MTRTRTPKTDGQTDAPPTEQTTEPKIGREAAFLIKVRDETGAEKHKVTDASILAAADDVWSRGRKAQGNQASYVGRAALRFPAVVAEAKRISFLELGPEGMTKALGEAIIIAALPAAKRTEPEAHYISGTDEAAEGPEEDEAAGPA